MTDCAKCGNCCDPVTLSADAWQRMGTIAAGGTPWPGRATITPRHTADAEFCREHWTPVAEHTTDGGEYLSLECDKFDPATRLCTAHDARPPICAGYPWYGKEPYRHRGMSPQCSYQADARGLLPIVEVT